MGQRAAGLAKRGTYTGRIAFNGGEEADVKYRPDGLSPVLLIKLKQRSFFTLLGRNRKKGMQLVEEDTL
jgi:hypothetical protein